MATKKTGERTVRFLVGKAGVATMKHHTPKLELMAALTGKRLKDLNIRGHSIKFQVVFRWIDSTTVLQWLRNSDQKEPTFVANRVKEILHSSTVGEGRHVSGENNSADHWTRGLTIKELKHSV